MGQLITYVNYYIWLDGANLSISAMVVVSGYRYFRDKKGSLPNIEELISKKGLVISINLTP